jgi:hypothetical protein
MKTLSSLLEVLKYENREVVLRFSKEKRISFDDAEDIFQETKRWLWLCASSPGESVNMVGEAFVIDEMWHTFLLFTRDYADFCEKHFREFIHHVPKPSSEKQDVEGDRRKADLRKDYELIYDRLGSEVLLKWCKVYPERFQALRPKPAQSTFLSIRSFFYG